MTYTGAKAESHYDNSHAYLMDCMDALRQTPDKYFDLAVVDPPYQNNDAIGMVNGKKHSANRKQYHTFDNIAPPPEYFAELIRISKNHIVWGGNFFGLKGGVIAWNKFGTAFGEGEVAICSTHGSVRFFEYTWNGMLQQNMKDKEIRIHSTQKPVALYDWIYHNYLPNGGKVIDTHLGSGSNRIAADKARNIEFYGFEIDSEYYEAQEKRFKNYKAQLKLF